MIAKDSFVIEKILVRYTHTHIYTVYIHTYSRIIYKWLFFKMDFYPCHLLINRSSIYESHEYRYLHLIVFIEIRTFK